MINHIHSTCFNGI